MDASPLILFSRVERLDLIERLAPAVEVPDTVIHEVLNGVGWDKSALAGADWAKRFRVPDLSLPVNVERWNLDSGESQVISHCLRGGRWAVLDDQAARRCVQSLGLLMIGSLLKHCSNARLPRLARPTTSEKVATSLGTLVLKPSAASSENGANGHDKVEF
ncbi:MAG: hypothetical protein C1943_15875 [Halochromatium sp.]|nr:hypothetical protein [Halochromatium sp.]